MNEIEVITEKFRDIDVRLIFDETGDMHIPIQAVGEAVNYDRPKKGVQQIIDAHAEQFKGKIKDFPLSSEKTPIRALSRKGLDLFFIYCRKKEADPFKLWVVEKLEERRKLLSKLVDPQDRIIATAELIIQVTKEQKLQKARLDTLERQQSMLIEELVNINKPQKHHIQSRVRELVLLAKERNPDLTDQKLFSTIYGILRDWFKVSSYQEIPRERFDEALNLLDCLHQLISMDLLNFQEYISIEVVERLCSTYRQRREDNR